MQTTKRHGRATASVRESGGESEGGSGMSSELGSFLLIVATVVVLFFTLNYLLLALARVFA